MGLYVADHWIYHKGVEVQIIEYAVGGILLLNVIFGSWVVLDYLWSRRGR